MQNQAGLNQRRVQLITDQIDSLPTLPMVAARVLSLAASADSSVRDLTALIEADQALASRILTLVNSAGFGRAEQVASVHRAVTLLGFEAVRNSVLSLKVFDLFSRKGANAFRTTFDRRGFWKHCLAVAGAAQLLARRVRGRPAGQAATSDEEAFVAGLLHDLGKVALDYTLPKTFDQVARRVKSQRISFAEAELRILGMDHTAVGRRLALNWQFPEELVNVIWLHHHTCRQLPEALKGRRLVELVHLADLLAREQRIGLGSPCADAETLSEAAAQLGLEHRHLDDVGRALHRIVAEHVQAMGLDQADEADLFYESLQSANAELGAVNSHLLLTRRLLERQKRDAEVLAALGRLSGAGQRMQDALALIADAYLDGLDCQACAVYVFSDERRYVEGVIKSREREAAGPFLFELAADEAGESAALSPTPGDGPAVVAEEYGLARAERSHAWLFDRLGQLLGHGNFFSYPLRAENRRLGGVVFAWREGHAEPTDEELRGLAALAAAAGLTLLRMRERERLLHLTESLADSGRQAGEAQQELLKRRHLASVGAMAAGAAHEINNPLAIISGRAQILAESEQDAERHRSLQVISEQAERASGIISELMTFSRPLAVSRAATDIGLVLKKAAERGREQAATKGVELALNVPEGLPAASVDGRQLQWAVEELVGNALVATPAGGRIAVEAEYDQAGASLTLSVSDTGGGMDHETLARARDPFFSGRQAGRGRGFGLAKVQRIAEAHQAGFQLESAVGQGTIARLILDLSRAPQEAEAPVNGAV